jgi:hypothetical protein
MRLVTYRRPGVPDAGATGGTSGPPRAGDAAETSGTGAGEAEPSHVGPYLNRLSDLLWTMARWQEGEVHLAARERPRRRHAE